MAIFRPVRNPILYLYLFLIGVWKDYQSENRDNRITLQREKDSSSVKGATFGDPHQSNKTQGNSTRVHLMPRVP